ncbi:MAG: DUF3179 domain-containing protein [Bacteroidetes bacterium]|nr:DUF3179 domain-containing protein [Bacteroidota bacterium]
MKSWQLPIGLFFLIAIEILRVYFIMPFPGSQQSNTIDIAYFIDRNIWWLRLIGICITIIPLYSLLQSGKRWKKIIVILVLIVYGAIVYLFNFKFLADKLFFQPNYKLLVSAASDTTNRNKLIIGVVTNNKAKAYPIEMIGYHHQLLDTLCGEPALITYCTVCRSGRVYSPVVNGKLEKFRLVGMDHYNAIFEDATTHSWWRQENGKAITGILKGASLKEIPSFQMSLGDWLLLHPNSIILQPDSNFKKEYADLKGYDDGTIKSSLEKRDTASWKFKSWVIGIKINGHSKAYNWNTLAKNKLLQDEFYGSAFLLTMSKDERSFYVLNRETSNGVLQFSYDSTFTFLKDDVSNSTWNINGVCVDGAMKGTRLQPVQAYQEFWHSWQSFHPDTEKAN